MPNPNNNIIETIAAFGGFMLGIINLLFLIYQEFLKRGKLKVSTEQAEFKRISEGFYDLQISIILSSSYGDVFLKEMKLVNKSEVFGSYATQKYLTITRVYPYIRDNLLTLSPEKFEQKLVAEMNPKAIYVRDLKISNNSQTSYTILDRIESARFPDGWDGLPDNEWSLEFEYGNSKIDIPITVKLDSTSFLKSLGATK